MARRPVWLLMVLLLVLLAGHGIILAYVSSHLMLSGGLLLGVMVLVLARHLGLLAPALAVFRKHGSRVRGATDARRDEPSP